MCQPGTQPMSRQSRFNLIFFVQQEPEPEPEPEPRARIRFRFFLGQNDTVPAVPVPAPVPQHWCQHSLHPVKKMYISTVTFSVGGFLINKKVQRHMSTLGLLNIRFLSI